MIVAIDGPAGSGKGTIAKNIGERLNLLNIDTGAMYRAVSLKVIRNNIDLNDTSAIIKTCKSCNIKLLNNGVIYLDDEDVTKKIRSIEVTKAVTVVSKIKEVREIMKEKQREFAKHSSIVMEGRDITTEVFPNADYKFYLDASVEERAERRYKENIEKGIECTYSDTLQLIKERDYNDINRKEGALKITDDAIYIDSTNLSIDEVTNKIINIVKK